MNLLSDVQTKLDAVLLSDNILSFHLRRVEVNTIGGASAEIPDDAYVVYRFSPSRSIFGNGKPIFNRTYVNISYYFRHAKTTLSSQQANDRVDAVISKFLSDDRYRLANGKRDIDDDGSGYVGINVELLAFAPMTEYYFDRYKFAHALESDRSKMSKTFPDGVKIDFTGWIRNASESDFEIDGVTLNYAFATSDNSIKITGLIGHGEIHVYAVGYNATATLSLNDQSYEIERDASQICVFPFAMSGSYEIAVTNVKVYGVIIKQ